MYDVIMWYISEPIIPVIKSSIPFNVCLSVDKIDLILDCDRFKQLTFIQVKHLGYKHIMHFKITTRKLSPTTATM